MKCTEPSANNQLAPNGCRLQKCWVSQGFCKEPGPKYGSAGHGTGGEPGRTENWIGRRYMFAEPMVMSPRNGLAHQPQTRSALGGRSPTMAVLLVPSVMSLGRVRDFGYMTASYGPLTFWLLTTAA